MVSTRSLTVLPQLLAPPSAELSTNYDILTQEYSLFLASVFFGKRTLGLRLPINPPTSVDQNFSIVLIPIVQTTGLVT